MKRSGYRNARFSFLPLEERIVLDAALAADVAAGATSSDPANFTDVNGALFFTANEGASGRELWKMEGGSAVLVKDIRAGTSSSDPADLVNVAGTLYFTAYSDTYGRELWKSDGTAAGTVQVKDIRSGSTGASISELTVSNNTLFFVANDGSTGAELWKSDGTLSGTARVRNIDSSSTSSSPYDLTDVNGTLFFAATTTSGTELWKSDGTFSGTVQVKDIFSGTSGSNPGELTQVSGTLFFTATSGTSGVELWKSDGTSTGTVQVKDINAGTASSTPDELVNVGGTLYFTANDGSTGVELWKSDGTSSGTVRVKDINPGTVSSSPAHLTDVNGVLFFSADDGSTGVELWKSTGTSSGTVLVKDISSSNPTASEEDPRDFVNVGGTLYFAAGSPGYGTELWQSDGTTSGTVQVKDIYSGSSPSQPEYLTKVGSTLYFSATDGVLGREVWRTNEPPVVVTPIPNQIVNEDASNTVINLASYFNDPNLSADALTYAIVVNTNNSLVSATTAGNNLTLDYSANKNGTANITVRATDLAGRYVEDTFLVTVNAVQDTPTVVNAIADVTVSEDAPNTVLNLSSVFNDVDVLTNSDTVTLSVSGNTNSNLVTATLSGNNLTLAYAPNKNGTANITVRATDSAGNFVQDTFVVTVNAVQDIPTVVNAIADVTVTEDAPNTVLNLSSVFNDVDVLTNSDTVTLSVSGNTNSSLVTATLSGNNLTLAYAPNKNGTANITVRATDSAGNFVQDTFVVTVNAVQDIPTVVNAIADVTVTEDAPNTVLNLSSVFNDVDVLTNSDTVTLSVSGNTNSSLVTATLSGNNLTLAYAPNKNGTANITVRATDSAGNFVQDTFVVTVNAVQDIPTVVNAIADVTVTEDAPNTVLNLSSVFNDVDVLTNSDTVTLSVSGNTNSSLVTATLSGNNLTLAYAPNKNGTANITVRATDSAGNFVQDTFVVTVNAVQDIPTVVNAIADVTVTEDAPNTVLNLSSVFNDVDVLTNSDTVTLSVSSNSNAGLVTASLSGNELTLAYGPNKNGTANITVRATDSVGNFVEDTFVVTVNAVQDTPTVVNAIADVTVSEDAPNTVLNLSSVFNDVDVLTNSDTVTLSVSSNSNAGLVTASLSGNELTLAYAPNKNGTANITVRATDSAGNIVEDTFVVTVNAIQDTPTVVNAIANVTVTEDAPNTVLNLSSVFNDVDVLTNSDTVTLSVSSNSNAGLVTASLSGNELTLAYAPNKNGTANITVRATDSAGNIVEDTFVVTVNAIQDTPTVVNAIADVTVSEDAPNTVLNLSSVFDDVDVLTNSDTVTLSVSSNSNAGLVTASLSGNELTLTYASNKNGTANITVRATDSAGNIVEDTFVVTVNAIQDTPTVVSAIADVTVSEDAPNTVLNLSSVFNDVDVLTNSDTVTLSVSSNSNAGLVTASLSGNELTLAYGPNKNGTANITVRATDSAGNIVEDTFVVTVNAIQDTPTVVNAIADVTVTEDAPNTVLNLSSVFNDVDVLTNSDTVTLSVSSNSNAGLVTASLSGNELTLAYASNKNGTANITVRATDSAGNIVEDTFVVTVNAIQDTPTVVSAIADVTVSEDAPNTVLNLSSVFNDVDVLTNSDTVTLSVSSNSNAGLVTASLSGNELTLAYGPNKNGTANITVRATDSAGNIVEDTFVVTVNAIQDMPIVVNAIADVTVTEDAPNTVLNLSSVFNDVDVLTNSDTVTLSVTGNTNSSLVTATLSGNNLTLAYGPNKNGTANITVRATDSVGNFVEDTFVVTVNAVQDTPTVVNAIADVTVSEDAPNTVLNLSSVFDDVDVLTNSDTVTLSVSGNTNSSLVTATLSGNNLTLAYGPNKNGTANITVRATDSVGNLVEDTFVVTVNAVQDTPTAVNAIADVTVTEDAPNTVLNLSSVFNDVDVLTNSDTVTLSVSSNSNAGLVTASLSGNELTLAYGPNKNGTANITVRATDSAGNIVEDTFVVTVNAIQDTPTVVNAIADVTVTEDAPNTVLNLSSVFNDVDVLTNSDTVTLSVSSNSNAGLVTASLSGNELTLAYASNKNGTANITVRATDSVGNFVEDTFVVTVNAIQDTPVLMNALADVTVSEDAPNTVLDLSNIFTDVDILPNSDSITLSISDNNNIDLVTASLSGNELTLAYTPNKNGVANITVRAKDSAGNIVEDTFVVTVNAVQDAPTVVDTIADITVSEDAPNTVLDLSNVFADVDILVNSDTLILSIADNSNSNLVSASILGNELNLAYAPNQSGIANITIRATDQNGTYVETSLRVNVLAIGDAPALLHEIPDLIVREDSDVRTIDLSSFFEDPDKGDHLTYAIIRNENPTLTQVKLEGTRLSIAFSPDGSGESEIGIRATDQEGRHTDTFFNITVEPLADRPVIAQQIPDITVEKGALNTMLDLSKVFYDADQTTESLPLTLSVEGNTDPSLVSAYFEGNQLKLDYTSKGGSAEITIRATDTSGLFVETSMKVFVKETSSFPLMTPNPWMPTAHSDPTGISFIESSFYEPAQTLTRGDPSIVKEIVNFFGDSTIGDTNWELTRVDYQMMRIESGSVEENVPFSLEKEPTQFFDAPLQSSKEMQFSLEQGQVALSNLSSSEIKDSQDTSFWSRKYPSQSQVTGFYMQNPLFPPLAIDRIMGTTLYGHNQVIYHLVDGSIASFSSVGGEESPHLDELIAMSKEKQTPLVNAIPTLISGTSPVMPIAPISNERALKKDKEKED